MIAYTDRQPICKGWSEDKKYCITTAEGTRYLLRISPQERAGNREALFHLQSQVAALGVPMCQPVEFGLCEEGVYAVQTWIDGQDAEQVIPGLSQPAQYAYGQEAGRILKVIHSIPAPAGQMPWEVRFNRKIDRKLQMYRDCPLRFEGDQALIDYVQTHRHLLYGRPQCFQHGDYHIGNMMVENRDGRARLVIIDFDRYDFGDPWEEFNRIVWCAQASPCFASGMVDGYFDGAVPPLFWELLALYIGSNMLSSLPWAIPFGEREVQTMQAQASDVLRWYDRMTRTVPTWYGRPQA